MKLIILLGIVLISLSCQSQNKQQEDAKIPMIENQEIAVFGAGCFWCVEAVFSELKGVSSVKPGYTGGKTKNQNNKNIILSLTDIPGEGEHKIMKYMDLHCSTNDTNVVYGLDADLIQLSLVSHKPNIVLLRETTEYNIENTQSEYVYLKIDDSHLSIDFVTASNVIVEIKN